MPLCDLSQRGIFVIVHFSLLPLGQGYGQKADFGSGYPLEPVSGFVTYDKNIFSTLPSIDKIVSNC